VQEALTNIGKHAEASHVRLQIRQEGRSVAVSIEDDGKGFEPAAVLKTHNTLGLLSMEARVRILGGALEMSVLEKGGTRVSFSIPVLGEVR